jgi:hypothetical protein
MPTKRRLKKGWDAKMILFDPDTVARFAFLKAKNPGGFGLTHFVRRALKIMSDKQGYKEDVIQPVTDEEMRNFEEEI